MVINGSDFALGATSSALVISSLARYFLAKEEKALEQIFRGASSYPGWEKGKILNPGKSDYYNEASGLYSPPVPPDMKPFADWDEYTQAGYEEASLRELNYNAASYRTAWFTGLQWGSAIFLAITIAGHLTH